MDSTARFAMFRDSLGLHPTDSHFDDQYINTFSRAIADSLHFFFRSWRPYLSTHEGINKYLSFGIFNSDSKMAVCATRGENLYCGISANCITEITEIAAIIFLSNKLLPETYEIDQKPVSLKHLYMTHLPGKFNCHFQSRTGYRSFIHELMPKGTKRFNGFKNIIQSAIELIAFHEVAHLLQDHVRVQRHLYKDLESNIGKSHLGVKPYLETYADSLAIELLFRNEMGQHSGRNLERLFSRQERLNMKIVAVFIVHIWAVICEYKEIGRLKFEKIESSSTHPHSIIRYSLLVESLHYFSGKHRYDDGVSNKDRQIFFEKIEFRAAMSTFSDIYNDIIGINPNFALGEKYATSSRNKVLEYWDYAVDLRAIERRYENHFLQKVSFRPLSLVDDFLKFNKYNWRRLRSMQRLVDLTPNSLISFV